MVSWRRALVAVVMGALTGALVLVVALPRPEPDAGGFSVGAAASATTVPSTEPATPIPTTYADADYGAGALAPTKDKPQSKLWFNDGSWWSVMVGATDQRVRIHELRPDHTWRDTGVVVDERPASTADVLWEGTHLLVATRTGTGEIRLLRLEYVASGRTYRLLPGFPLVLARGGAPSVAIATDSLGRVWATFIQHGTVFVTNTDPSITQVAPAIPVPAATASATDDDVSCIVAVGKSIAVMWSDQAGSEFRYVMRNDADPTTMWQPMEVPLRGDHMVDGHVNMVALADGRILAAVKTSLDEAKAAAAADAPMIEVLERSPSGTWNQSVAGQLSDRMTRPVLLVDEAAQLLLLLTTSPEIGGSIYYKASALDRIGFNLGRGVPFMTAPGATLNNPTTVKGLLPMGAPIVVLASDEKAHRYYHAELPAR
ncbi:MAG: hypothetical protein JWN29_2981 [Acidimicrobiales bacterium]|nr:hypothetical protein [Acidimicrobiales bacterium]